MSADNIVWILKLRDEYRVKYMGAPDNIYFSFITFSTESTPIFTRIIEYFEDAESFNNLDDASRAAWKIFDDYRFVEYGVTPIDLQNYSWQDIQKLAVPLAVAEILSISDKGYWGKKEDWYSEEIAKLEKFLNVRFVN